ncbi:Hpt domain-containing protein [Aestuariicella sp. G3-2]|uniref:Hpt domain-containing protein n=1 Tax=Pseudomaricurvus albidus TaxID=2842452 RepID=UPI001C0BCF6B|nr:Hpt domain-containing protein [Aestuariicella albida]MBU3071178.1 Hpt domain-containing protein [Aestuariicella albida]
MSDSIDKDIIVMLKEVMEEDFQELLDTFLNDSRERIPLLQEQLASGDSEGLRQSAHSLKGSSSNLGAIKLSELCFQIEQKAKQQQLEDLAGILQQVESEFERVALALQTI